MSDYLVCVGRWQMSKSRGNVVDPFDRMSSYTDDGLRYFLMKDGVAHSDGSSYLISFHIYNLHNLFTVRKNVCAILADAYAFINKCLYFFG